MTFALLVYAGAHKGTVFLGPPEVLCSLAEALGPGQAALDRAPAPPPLSVAALREIERVLGAG